MAREPQRSTDILDAVALLVVDMQDVFIKMVPNGTEIAERCGFAIEAARLFGLKVLFTEQVPEKLGPTHAALLALAPGARVFAKTAFSALQADGLQQHLHKLGVYHLLLVGIETPVCVYQTALHAHDSDFDVTVLSDCVGGRRSDDGRVALEAIARNACHVLPAETVFYSMLATSANPRFGDLTRLVKKYSQAGVLAQVVLPAPAPEAERAAEPSAPPVETPTDEAEPIAAAPEAPAPEPAPEPAEEEAEAADDDGFGPSDDEREERDDSEQGQPGGRPRRGRRRRGGARRRRARERAASAAGNGGTGAPPHSAAPAAEGSNEPAPAPAPAIDVPPAAPAATDEPAASSETTGNQQG